MTEQTERRFCIACGYHIEPHDECKYVECPMRNPIRDTGDALGWRCTICNEPASVGCDCFVKLRCRACGRSRMTKRDETDPAGTFIVDCLCPECDDGGGKPETLYFDKLGRQWNGEQFR